ncbi:MAG: hypothetical protein PHZ07_02135 [Patescibacteria group bacterium]|nr:hypothetical protein [Patescibacteria group bacterium]MDD4304017.1 hypothetical protein [Patescibacteria group bacterium]MDD4694894.1 hypothetical protein [Patescibacteria group bacterium]
MQKSNKIIGIVLVSVLLVALIFIIIFKEKDIKKNYNNFQIELNNKDEKQDISKSEIGILYNQYIADTENKENELKSLLKQDKDLKFIPIETLYQSELTNNNPKYPTLNCGKEKVEFTFIPDPYRKEATENVIFEDGTGIQVINKETNKILQQEKVYGILDIEKLNFNNLDYYITSEYTGGAHCCFEERVIVCKNGKFNIGDVVNYGSNGELGDFFIKNNQIYFTKSNGRFDYFNLSYTSSRGMEYLAFYKLDTNSNKFIDVSKEFPDYYSKLAKQQNDWLIKLKKYQPSFFSGAEELWYYPLIKRLTANYLSGESKEIYEKQFLDDFNYFIDGSSVDKQHFLFPIEKKDIKKIFDDAMKILIGEYTTT